MNARLLVIACAGLIILHAAPAAAAEKMQAGLWKISTSREVNGKTVQSPEMTQCIKPDQLKRPEGAAPQPPTHDCKMENLKTEGNKTSFHTVCPSRQSESFTTITYLDPQHYTTEMRTSIKAGGRQLDTIMKMDARRVGDCPN